jgi:hypothetical protein
VKNPYNPNQIKRISLSPQDVDGIVLWTKNATPMLPKLTALSAYNYYFQHTLTAYHSDIECGLQNDKNIIISTFKEISAKIGAERMVWRYDPIVISPRYCSEYHIFAFEKLCKHLSGYTEKCVISFVIPYKSIAGNLAEFGNIIPNLQEKIELVKCLLEISNTYKIELCACCEIPEIYELGVSSIACIDGNLLGMKNAAKDKNQRPGCNCAASVDIGAYNSCPNGCRYCYANHNETLVQSNFIRHNPMAEFLVE